MNKKLIGTAFAAVGLMVSCGTNIPSDQTSLPEQGALLTSDLKETVGMKTVTGLSILSSTPFVASQGTFSDQPFFVEGETDPVTEEVAVEDFTQYITLMDLLLSEEGTPFTIVERVSDRPEYAYLLDITTRDLAGVSLTYTMYFNYLGDSIEQPPSSEVSSEDLSSEDSLPSEEASSEIDVSSEVGSSEAIVSSESVDSSVDSTASTETTPSDTTTSEEASSEATPSTSVDNPTPRVNSGEDDDSEDGEDDDVEDEEDDIRDQDEHEEYDDSELRDESDEGEHERFKERGLGDDVDGQEIFLEGVAIFDGVEYALIGVQEIENEDDEVETETKFFITLDDQNWIRIKSELEVDLVDNETEEKYSVSMKKDGEFSKMSFKTETENNGEMKVSLKTLIQGELVSYTFRRKINEETGQEYILIRVIENGQVLHIEAIPVLDAVTGEIVYEFTVRETGRGYEGRPGHGGHDDRDRD
jgi:hypothetical protein